MSLLSQNTLLFRQPPPTTQEQITAQKLDKPSLNTNSHLLDLIYAALFYYFASHWDLLILYSTCSESACPLGNSGCSKFCLVS